MQISAPKMASKLEDNAFNLTEEEINKINFLGKLEQRNNSKGKHNKKVVKFSEQLSLEAQIAMQLARRDTKELKQLASPNQTTNGSTHKPSCDSRTHHVKFADVAQPETQFSKRSTLSFTQKFMKNAAVFGCLMT